MSPLASRAAEAHIEAQARLRGLTVAAVEAAWAGLPAYNRADVPAWLSQVVPVVLTAQRSSAAITGAFLARHLGRAPRGLRVDELLGRGVRGGADPQEVYRRPFVTLWSALGAGKAFEEASAAALARATSTAAMDVQKASFATYAQAQQGDPAIKRWRRVADAGACQFCAMIDGAIVKSPDAAPLHNHCGCGLEPVEEALEVTPLPAGVAVHDHGELGPVLGDPAHDFTSAADIPAL